MNKVREIRKERGMSQELLAKNTEISRKYLSMIERQIATPSISIAMRIGGALDVSIDKIFFDLSSAESASYPKPVRFIDLFCGIGGFRYASQCAFDKLGLEGECVFSSDIDKYAQMSYEANFGEKPAGDITKSRHLKFLILIFCLVVFHARHFQFAVCKRDLRIKQEVRFFSI